MDKIREFVEEVSKLSIAEKKRIKKLKEWWIKNYNKSKSKIAYK